MKISHFGGVENCDSVETLEIILAVRFGTGVNEFWISDQAKTPCLAILVNNEKANLTYFPEEGHLGFQSFNDENDLNPDDFSVFYTNTPDEEIEVANDSIIPFETALIAAKEYLMTLKIPTFVKWIEL